MAENNTYIAQCHPCVHSQHNRIIFGVRFHICTRISVLLSVYNCLSSHQRQRRTQANSRTFAVSTFISIAIAIVLFLFHSIVESFVNGIYGKYSKWSSLQDKRKRIGNIVTADAQLMHPQISVRLNAKETMSLRRHTNYYAAHVKMVSFGIIPKHKCVCNGTDCHFNIITVSATTRYHRVKMRYSHVCCIVMCCKGAAVAPAVIYIIILPNFYDACVSLLAWWQTGKAASVENAHDVNRFLLFWHYCSLWALSTHTHIGNV